MGRTHWVVVGALGLAVLLGGLVFGLISCQREGPTQQGADSADFTPGGPRGTEGSSVESVCASLDVAEGIAEVPAVLRAGVAGESVNDVFAAVEQLRVAADVLPAAGPASDALETWASNPEDLDALDAVAHKFSDLEEEVDDQCEPR